MVQVVEVCRWVSFALCCGRVRENTCNPNLHPNTPDAEDSARMGCTPCKWEEHGRPSPETAGGRPMLEAGPGPERSRDHPKATQIDRGMDKAKVDKGTRMPS